MIRKLSRWALAALLIAGVTLGFAQGTATNTATWSWSAPTQYTDGTSIPAGTVITYKVFTGSATNAESSAPAWTGTAVTATTSGYADGATVYGYVEACVTACSSPSNEASKTFPIPAPAAPAGLAVK